MKLRKETLSYHIISYHLTTVNFFPKEARSTSLLQGLTQRALTAFVFAGSSISSLSLGATKLIWKIQQTTFVVLKIKKMENHHKFRAPN